MCVIRRHLQPCQARSQVSLVSNETTSKVKELFLYFCTILHIYVSKLYNIKINFSKTFPYWRSIGAMPIIRDTGREMQRERERERSIKMTFRRDRCVNKLLVMVILFELALKLRIYKFSWNLIPLHFIN